jgi:glycosyltransferase involved in cell wall biosynthesis
VGAADPQNAQRVRHQFPDDLQFGHLVEVPSYDQVLVGQRLLDALCRLAPDVVFINVLTSLPEMSLAAYLPPAMRRVAIVHNITPGTYDGARAVGPYIHAAVGVSPRIRDHLVGHLRFPAQRTVCVPNAFDVEEFRAVSRTPAAPCLRVLFLGRIIDIDKGVFWLPPILESLSDIPLHLTVAGDGPDLAELRRRCARLEAAGRVTFLGRVPHERIPNLAAAHDVFLMTSRFEGFGYTLAEAMAAGCAAVSSRISGVTDFVVRDHETGLLYPIGDTAAAAGALRRLAGDEPLRRKLAQAGAADVAARFSLATMATGYAGVLEAVASAPPLRALRAGTPFQPLRVGGRWRRWMPEGIKNFLRKQLNK